MDKYEYITKLARFLCENKMTMTVPNLADHLNWNGFKTSYETEYQGGRGTSLIHAVYDWLVSQEREDDAEIVALAFKKPDGGYAYEK